MLVNIRFSLHTRAFTLIEMLVVISIIGILSILSYAPYSYYADIAKVRNTRDLIEQGFSQAKISAVSGLSLSGSDTNLDTVVLLQKGASNISIIAMKPGDLNIDNAKVVRTIAFEKGVSVYAFSGVKQDATTLSDYKKIAVRFYATTGSGVGFFGDSEGINTDSPITSSEFANIFDNTHTIQSFSGGIVSLRGANQGNLAIPFSFKTY